MGGLFRAPKPVIVQPPPPAATASPVVAAAEAPAQSSPEAAASAQRVQAQQRVGQGLAGLIATSPLGALNPAAVLPRKTLLGE